MNLPLIDNTLFIDNSTLEKFTTCPRSAEYYSLYKREANKSSSAINYGKATHEALRAQLLGKPLSSQQQEIISYFETSPQETSEFEWRTPDLCLSLIEKYNANYPCESFELVQRDGKLLVELPFAVPLGTVSLPNELTTVDTTSINVVWTGRIDAIIRENDKLMVMDHKTTSMLGPAYFDEFENSSQMLGYVWAAQHLLGESVHGVLINALCSRKPTKTGKSIEFARQRFYPQPERIIEWHENTLQVVSDFVMHAARAYFPMHTKWCVGKYGKCQYIDVCTLVPEQRLAMLMSELYKPVTWSPLT